MPDLGAFSGIEQVKTAAEILQDTLGELARQASKAGEAVQKAVGMGRGSWRSGGEGVSLADGYAGVEWGEALTPEQKIAMGYGVKPGAESSATAAAFKDLADRIDAFKGTTDDYWSQLLNKEIPYLLKGATSSANAQEMVSAIMKTFIPGIMQQLADPKTPLEMRKILQELLQFAQSGSLQIDKLRERLNQHQKDIIDAVNHTSENVTASIGGAIERYAALSGSHK